jgi:hypothetical protein
MVNSALKQRIANLQIMGRIGLFSLLLAAACLLVLPVAISLHGTDGFVAACAGIIVVWFASSLGMAVGELFHGPNAALSKLLLGMVIRMAIPLAACLLALLTDSRLAEAGFVFYVLVFYLAALPVDTILAVLGQSNHKLASGG